MHDKHIIESMTDDDDTICPICCGPMDDTDLSFFPCPCKFQLCLWCFNEIREKDNRCPNCRKPYDQSLFTVHNSSNIENEDGANASSSRKGKKSCRHTICRRESNHGTSPMDDELLRLQKTRIVQRNLVYITGMVREDASESVLLGDDMFGKYGKIQKVVVNKSFLVVNSTVNFYVTFERDEDALACILAVNGFRYKGKLLRASFGTTKYCNSYIHGVPCDNPDCIYLHAEAPTEYCFLRDEMSDKDDKFFQCTHPGYGSLPYSRNTIKRMEIRYGDELPEKDEELCFFGVDSLWEDQFTFNKVTSTFAPTHNIYFSANIPVVHTKNARRIGEQVNLNDLFGSATPENGQSTVNEQSILEQLLSDRKSVSNTIRNEVRPVDILS